MSYDPAADLAERYPEWTVGVTAIGWGIREALSRRSKVILVESATSSAEQRCSLAHAVAHLDLEHHPVPAGLFDRRQELAADRLAARRLIPLELLAATLAWSRDPREIADELRVDRATLAARVAHLSSAERGRLAVHG